MAPRARFELATLRLTAGECKTLNALFGVAYVQERLESQSSVGQLLGNLHQGDSTQYLPTLSLGSASLANCVHIDVHWHRGV